MKTMFALAFAAASIAPSKAVALTHHPIVSPASALPPCGAPIRGCCVGDDMHVHC